MRYWEGIGDWGTENISAHQSEIMRKIINSAYWMNMYINEDIFFEKATRFSEQKNEENTRIINLGLFTVRFSWVIFWKLIWIYFLMKLIEWSMNKKVKYRTHLCLCCRRSVVVHMLHQKWICELILGWRVKSSHELWSRSQVQTSHRLPGHLYHVQTTDRSIRESIWQPILRFGLIWENEQDLTYERRPQTSMKQAKTS